MYSRYFSFEEPPFSISPDPHYLYLSRQHQEALGHLLYGVQNDGGFVLLTGEVGTGKTTICQCLLGQLPENCDVAFVINPRLSVEELLATLCDEFRIAYPKENTSTKVFVDLINTYLLEAHARGRKALLIIDEAQNLSKDVLEQVRLLTNLETSKRKLLQIILLGQPELRDKLAGPELRQLAQRIVARYHLGPLRQGDVASYVNHRLATAGFYGELFSKPALRKLYRLSGGIPRLINVICDRALLGAYVMGKRRVDKPLLKSAAREVLGEVQGGGVFKKRMVMGVTTILIMLILGMAAFGAYRFIKFPSMGISSLGVKEQGSTSVLPHLQSSEVMKKASADLTQPLGTNAQIHDLEPAAPHPRH